VLLCVLLDPLFSVYHYTKFVPEKIYIVCLFVAAELLDHRECQRWSFL